MEIPGDTVGTIVAPAFARGFPRSTQVINAGDVDGDGRSDVLVTNTQGHGGDEVRSSLLFGGTWPKLTRLPAGGSRGFTVPGIAAVAGDVNGDGRADIISCGIDGTRAKILLGRADRRPAVESGFRAERSRGCPRGIGNVDGDRFDDLIIDQARGATIVFGRRSPGVVDPARPGANSVRVDTSEREFIVPVGDLNGDSRADLVIDPSFRSRRILVLFGRRRSGTFDLGRRRLPAIVGLEPAQRVIASAGDVNGDRVGDLIIGESVGGAAGASGSRACVVLGRRGTWPSTTSGCTGPRSIVIRGAPTNAGLGGNVGSAGDLDHDGFGDLWVAAPNERIAGSNWGGGAVYVVYGRGDVRRIDVGTDPRVVRLAAAPDLGESIGMVAGYGSAAASAGDLTGDGRADIVLGSDLSGTAWVVSNPTP